ncbi:MAG TPA: hypothetical protein VF720_11995 [Candidatus Eisenbacteria bacterium]
MRLATKLSSVLLASALVLTSGTAMAAHLTIIDTESDVTVQPDGNFEGGFGSSQNGQHDWSFGGTWIALQSATTSGSGIIYFVDPNSGDLEDIYEVSWNWDGGLATIRGRFESDANGVLVSGRTIPNGFPTVNATPGNVDVLGLFRDPSTGDPVSLPSHLTMLVTFDYAPVPTEAATWTRIKTTLGN